MRSLTITDPAAMGGSNAGIKAPVAPLIGVLIAPNTPEGPYSAGVQQFTITATGGAGSYSYAWERVSGDTELSPSNSAISNPVINVSGTVTNAGIFVSAVFRCKVTDSAGNAVWSPSVDVGASVYPGDVPP